MTLTNLLQVFEENNSGAELDAVSAVSNGNCCNVD